MLRIESAKSSNAPKLISKGSAMNRKQKNAQVSIKRLQVKKYVRISISDLKNQAAEQNVKRRKALGKPHSKMRAKAQIVNVYLDDK